METHPVALRWWIECCAGGRLYLHAHSNATLEWSVQVGGQKPQVVEKLSCSEWFLNSFHLHSSVVLCSEEDENFQYMDHDYEVPQQKVLKKICNRVKWTRDEVIICLALVSFPCDIGSMWNVLLFSILRAQHVTLAGVLSQQDERLKRLVEQHGTDDWAFIAGHLQVSWICFSKFPLNAEFLWSYL